MKKFLLLNQEEEPLVDIQWNKFTCGILELAGVYVVRIATPCDGHSYTVAVYRDIKEAAEAINKLKDFAFTVNEDNRGFAFPISQNPVSVLELIDSLS